MPYPVLNITMPPYLEELYSTMLKELNKIELEEGIWILRLKSCIGITQQAIDVVRSYVVGEPFAGLAEEIFFFKYIKPRFYCQLIYYLKVYRYEIEKPSGSRKEQKKYFKKKRRRTEEIFKDNTDFYAYFNSGASHLDSYYFLRRKKELDINLDSFYPDADPTFCTSHDYKLSRLLAAEMLTHYITETLDHLKESPAGAVRSIPADMTWTAPKNFLIELIYAIHYFGAVNYGKADIKVIADGLERLFNINLGNVYRTFQEIRIRKKGRTHFLDQLKEILLKKMDDADENPHFR